MTLCKICFTSEILFTKRHWAIVCSIMFSLGYIVPSLLSYLLPKWNDLMLALSLISAIFIPISFLIPESPQFLWSIGDFFKSEQVLQRFARSKNKKLPPGTGSTTF